jgi:ribosomal protein S18 acetylase RimI-like enzyme
MRVIKVARRHLEKLMPLFEQYRQSQGQGSDATQAEEFLSQRLRRSEAIFLLAQRNDDALGFAIMYPVFSAIDLKQDWLISDLFSIPGERTEDVAEELLQEAQKQVRRQNHKGILLEIRRNSGFSSRFYQKLNFETLDRSYRYWQEQ